MSTLCYYYIDKDVYLNKNLAIYAAKGNLSNIKLYFDDHLYENLNWAEEPQDDWETIYARHLQAIRAQYDYMALWYSGGYDSHTILMVCIKNKIKIDELVILDRRPIGDVMGVGFAMNTAYNIKKKVYPDININIINFDVHEQANLYKDWGTDWIYKMPFGVTRLGKTSKHFYYGHYDFGRRAINPNAKRCDINGHDKCKLYVHDNKWYTFFTDVDVAHYYDNPQIHFYYIPEIYKKQVYNTMRWFESLPIFEPDFVHKVQGRGRNTNDNIFTNYYSAWNIAMGRYPLDKNDFFSTHGFDKFLYGNDETSPDQRAVLKYYWNHDPGAYNIYMRGLNELKKTTNDYKLDINPTILSKPYYVRNFNKKII